MLSVEQLAKMIDHAILRPGQTDADMVAGVEVARKYRVRCFVPKAYQVAKAREMLEGSGVLVCVPIGFPQGFNLPEVKRLETELSFQQGAQEIDMVINTCALKSGDFDLVERDIAGVVAVAKAHGALVKAIIETCVLTNDEKVAAAKIAERAGAAYVKTSTGMLEGGATVADIALLRASVSPAVIVKASGGVNDVETALALHAAGAGHFGTAQTATILEGLKRYGNERG
jgi:deoxyribose-phosphate aldolase